MGGRLGQFWKIWDRLRPDSWVQGVLREGYRIEFTSRPPSRDVKRPTPVPGNQEKRAALEKEITDLLLKGAITPLDADHNMPLYRSVFFLAPKKTGDWRPIINLRPLNSLYVRPQKFRMETLHQIVPTLSIGSWAVTIDLKDAYLHIPMHPSSRRFLSFQYKGTDYIFKALPFGLSTSPRVFTRVTRVVLAYLRRRGISVFAYIDDWLLLAKSEQEAYQTTQFVVRLLQDLGWIINWDKSALTPTQVITYLGATIDFRSGTISPTTERVKTLTSFANSVIRKPTLQAREWLRLLGLMASLVDVLPFCRLFMRPIQIHLLKHYKPASDHLFLKVPVTPEARRHINWWTQPSNVATGKQFGLVHPQETISTDASLEGWGAVWGTRTTSGTWSPEESTLHINLLELEGVRRAIHHWAPLLHDTEVTVLSDNSTAVIYINRQGGTRSKSLCHRTWELLHFCRSRRIHLKASHLAGPDNVMADALSRSRYDENEWSLQQEWADILFDVFGRPLVDLFASRDNTKLPTFCSRFHQDEAWATDALSISWDGMEAYAFPPWSLIHRVLLKIRQSQTSVLLVAPMWPNQHWFPLLMSLLVDLPFRFPHSQRLLSQNRGRTWHQNLQDLHLTAWKLSGIASKRQAFEERLRGLQLELDDTQLSPLTIVDYNASGSGHRRDLSIPWKLQ